MAATAEGILCVAYRATMKISGKGRGATKRIRKDSEDAKGRARSAPTTGVPESVHGGENLVGRLQNQVIPLMVLFGLSNTVSVSISCC